MTLSELRDICHLQISEEEGALQEAQIIGVWAEWRRQGGTHSHVSRTCKCIAYVDLGAGNRSTAQDRAQVRDAKCIQGCKLCDCCLHVGGMDVR